MTDVVPHAESRIAMSRFKLPPRRLRCIRTRAACVLTVVPLMLTACRAVVDRTDRDVASVIAERQRAALAQPAPVRVSSADDRFDDPGREAYAHNPNPRSAEVAPHFAASTTQPARPATRPTSAPSASSMDYPSATTTAPSEEVAANVFTLTDALAWAQANRRELQTAEEQLYLAALALTLERHLWTPIFASNLHTVYGNFGEVQTFDQAMRFVADLSATQRLPYGGEFTAKAISTLIRDVKKTLTASEGSSIELGLKVPFLRNAGHVAQEQLIQLERELTYAVRTFERFRRQQLVDVAGQYFDLLRTKQSVADSETNLKRVGQIFERAREFEARGLGSLLETQRTEQNYLAAELALADARERFRAQADRFKLLIGMPVDAPLERENLESIESIEKQVTEGRYPLLLRPPAIEQEEASLQVALDGRLDLLSANDRIDDARRGVAIAKNALLPDLDLTSTVTWDTDPNHFRLGDFSFERTTWRSELIFGLPLERTAERNRYRGALIDVRQAQRDYQSLAEGIRAEVRSAVNQIRLQDRTLQIQQRNLEVAENRVEYARIRYFEFNDIEVREWLDAQDEWTVVRNSLNLAKTEGWIALLNFRLATETLRIDEIDARAGSWASQAQPPAAQDAGAAPH